MKRKKTVNMLVVLFMVLLLVIPIPVGKSAGGSVKTYQSLTYKIVSIQDDKGSRSKAFFFPNNFKNNDELLINASTIEQSQLSDGSDVSSDENNIHQSPSETEGSISQGTDDTGDGLDELGELSKGELDVMQIVPNDKFIGKVFSCGFDGQESIPSTLIRNTTALDNFINGPDSKNSGGDAVNKNGAFLRYAETLDEEFFKTRSLMVKYYYSKNGHVPTIDSVASINGTIIAGVTLKKPKGGETDLRGCLLLVEIDKQYLKNIKSCRFMILPAIHGIEKIPLGG